MKQGTPRVRHLADLKAVKAQLLATAARAAEEAAAQALQERQRGARRSLFQSAVGRVQPLPATTRVQHLAKAPLPVPRQHLRDEQEALRQTMSDEVDVSSLLHTDDSLSWRRPGIGSDVVHKLRRGKWAVQRQIDLHGQRSDEARESLALFLRDMHRAGVRCVRVVHGKGLGSPGKSPVLKGKVQGWLIQRSEVLAFVQAQPNQGGAGALLVLLQPVHRSPAGAPQ